MRVGTSVCACVCVCVCTHRHVEPHALGLGVLGLLHGGGRRAAVLLHRVVPLGAQHDVVHDGPRLRPEAGDARLHVGDRVRPRGAEVQHLERER